jgi:hypothetical protein
MNIFLRKNIKIIQFLLILIILIIPLLSQAATTPSRATFFGPIVPLECHCTDQFNPATGEKDLTTAPDYGCVLQVIQNLINFAVSLGILAVTFWIAVAGFQLIINQGNPGKITETKNRIYNSVIGIAVILSAWLIVNFVMNTLYDTGTYGPWNSILADGKHACLEAKLPAEISVATVYSNATTVAPGSSSSGVGTNPGGRCAVRNSGQCSIANLTPYFGTAATSFSKICSHESGGQSIQSTTDLASDGRPLSFGLLQLNITAHTINGIDCSKATDRVLTGATLRARSVNIIDNQLYNQCKAMALDPITNLKFASSLYNNPKVKFGPWKADNVCGLSG